MNLYTIALCLLFIELILETGVGLQSVIVTGLSFKNLFIYGMFMFLLVRVMMGKRIYVVRDLKVVVGLLVGVILYSLIMILFQGSVGGKIVQGLMAWKTELVDGLLCFLVFFYFSSLSDSNLKFMIPSLMLIIGVAALATLSDAMLSGVSIFGHDETSFRTRGAFGESNQTAAVLAMYFQFAVSLFLVRGKFRLLYGGIAIVILAAIASTVSRGGLVSAGLGAIFLLWMVRDHLSIASKTLVIMSAPLILVLAWLLLPETYQTLLLERFSFLGQEKIDLNEASAGRTMLWEFAYNLWKESPLLGRGWNSFQITTGVASHNTYMEYLVSLGLFGFVLIMVFWSKLFLFFFKSRRFVFESSEGILLGGICAGLLSILLAIFFVNLYKPWLFVWSFLGVAAAYANGIRVRRLVYAVEQERLRSKTAAE